MVRPGATRAPAKLNLTLEILAPRADGYHGVRSVMLPLALYDEIRWDPAERFAFRIEGDAPADESNLVIRAFRALDIAPAIDVTLIKNIPAGGGLGGGSSDAAAIVRAAARGAFGDIDECDYVGIARSLGSDVPFFLAETGALVEATGERVTALGALPEWWAVVVLPGVAVATAGAYEMLDAARRTGYTPRPRNSSPSLLAVEAIQRSDFEAAARAAQNDFEPVIASSEPRVAAALQALRDSGARLAMLCGSGSSCVALAETQEEAEKIAARMRSFRTCVVPLHHAESWRRERVSR
jgi:4-diphosphocytidyl-2-C-methyl-D-erythritol kinase